MSEEIKFNMIYIVLGIVVLIMGLLSFMTSMTLENFNDYLIAYISGIIFCASGTVLVYSGLKGKDASKHPPRYEGASENNIGTTQSRIKANKMSDYGIISILVGTLMLIFSAIYYMDANHRYNNPLFILANESVKSEIENQLFLSTVGLIVGGVLLIIGFILVAKFFGNEKGE